MSVFTILLDTGAQKSVCRNVTGRKVTSSSAVFCRNIKAVEELGYLLTLPHPAICPRQSTQVLPGFVNWAIERQVQVAAAPGVDCNVAGPPQKEGCSENMDEPGPGSPVGQGVRADCRSAEPPVKAPDSVKVVAGGEDGVLVLSELVAGFPHPLGHRGVAHGKSRLLVLMMGERCCGSWDQLQQGRASLISL